MASVLEVIELHDVVVQERFDDVECRQSMCAAITQAMHSGKAFGCIELTLLAYNRSVVTRQPLHTIYECTNADVWPAKKKHMCAIWSRL